MDACNPTKKFGNILYNSNMNKPKLSIMNTNFNESETHRLIIGLGSVNLFFVILIVFNFYLKRSPLIIKPAWKNWE